MLLAGGYLSTPASAGPSTAPHPKSYMEVSPYRYLNTCHFELLH